jgi:mannose-6-phosphate isomerase-like protein (cupin superfamily)
MKKLAWKCALLALAVGGSAAAQSAPAGASPGPRFDEMTDAQITARAAELLKQAQASPSGSASITLETYPRHFTMLTVRTKSGGAEQHDQFADIFVVLDGEATEIIGGTIPNSTSAKPGELRGSHVEGGVEHPMHKGDIVHIAPGVPHQTMLAPGKTFTYYVVKVEQ